MMRAVLTCVVGLALACSDSKMLGSEADGGAGRETGDGTGGRGGSGGAGTAGRGGAAAADSGNGGSAGPAGPPSLNADELLAASCNRYVEPAQLLPANILFVLDRSSSMVCNPPPTTDSVTCERESKRALPDVKSKGELTQSAIVESLNILPEESWVGLSYFSNDDMCGVQSSPSVPMRKNSAAQKGLIRTSLLASQPNGATPLVGATILAYQYLYGLAREGSIRGNNFVVLLTDGKQSETCGDPGRCTTAEECTNLLIEQEVPKASGDGVWIRTFVIGVPGSELDSRTLSRIADAGRTRRPGCDTERDCHFDVSRGGDFSADLRLALQNIVGQTRSCDLPAPRPESGDQDRVNVLYTPANKPRELVPQVQGRCDGSVSGWQYAEDQTRIRICGKVCSELQADPDAQLQVVIGCPIQGPQ